MAVFQAVGGLHPEEHSRIIVQRPELDHLLAHVENGDLYVALSSPRQTGKTTLLYQLQARLHGHGYGVVYLDLSGLNDLSKAQFYQHICTDIHHGLGAFIDTAGEAALPPHDITEQTAFARYLTWLSAHTPRARKLILIFDEVAGVPGETAASLFPSLRSFFQRGRRPLIERELFRKVLCIFAGALDLQVLMRGSNSPLRNVCVHFALDDFAQRQVQSLAGNLAGFTPEAVEALVEAVHGWCDGHPYLTQRLFVLIDASEEWRRTNLSQLSQAVEQLVATHFIYGNDPNLSHILHYLREREPYRTPVFTILKQAKRKSVMYAEDLLSIGVIKRTSDQYLSIRNNIYRQALDTFFAEGERS
jgi:hypothetical protein